MCLNFFPAINLSLTLYVVNGWDSYIDNNEAKSWGTYSTWQPNDDFFISLGTIHGGEGWGDNENGDVVQMYDIVATYALPQVEKLSLGFNFDWGQSEDGTPNGNTGHWWAAVGYAMYDFTDNQQGAFRYEYFDDGDGAKGFDMTMYTMTYTQNITIAENLLLRPEIRYNHYSKDIIESSKDTDGIADHDDEFIFAFGTEYVF